MRRQMSALLRNSHDRAAPLIARRRRRSRSSTTISIAAVLVGALLTSCNSARAGSGGQPDPGSATLHALEAVRSALPPDARVLRKQDAEPEWSSCDGRAGTAGWTDVLVTTSFRTSLTAAALVRQATEKLLVRGWTLSEPIGSGPDPSGTWTRKLSNGSTATAILGIDNDYLGRHWSLSADAPPQGPQVSGC